MPPAIETQITVSEERLRLAMLASDVGALDELISSDLLFTNHLGQVESPRVCWWPVGLSQSVAAT